MSNMWKKKMVEQGYYYLDDPIHSMAEFFKTIIQNLKKSIPASVPLRNRKKGSKKGPKKRIAVTFGDSKDKDSEDEHKSKMFCLYHGMCGHTID